MELIKTEKQTEFEMKITETKIIKLEPEIWPIHYINLPDDMSVYLVHGRVDGKLHYQLVDITHEMESDAGIDLDNYLNYGFWRSLVNKGELPEKDEFVYPSKAWDDAFQQWYEAWGKFRNAIYEQIEPIAEKLAEILGFWTEEDS